MTDPWLVHQIADDVVHTVPLDDEIVHEFAPDCPCEPTPIGAPGGTILSHSSLDGREHPEEP
ncbi:hypothetical protein [Streptomyces sp. NPDC060188]|uniref:hypothetical protein n=1 Tax=Streptomyces sp. NPDC060188 TaxID=3347068 RepID=UPI0036571375